MTRSANTGPAVPAWIREEIARQERTWPLAALSAALGALLLLELVLGAIVWNATGPVVYAFP
jgi:hypothetical protein